MLLKTGRSPGIMIAESDFDAVGSAGAVEWGEVVRVRFPLSFRSLFYAGFLVFWIAEDLAIFRIQ